MKKIFFSLLAAACALTANAQVTPEAGQTYYIQNVDGGQFFSRGNDWGTQATLDNQGMPFTLVGSDLNSVQLQIKGQTSVLGFDTGLYTDANGGNARSYKIEGNETDGFTIISTTGYACTINGTAIDGSTTAEPAKWKFLTKAQRDEFVANAIAAAKTAAYAKAGLTEDEVVKEAEITSKITNSTLANNVDGWTKTIVRNQNGQPASGSGCTEFWQATGSLTQTISGLTPNGLYRLTMRAQYRAISDNANCYNLYAEGYDNVNATIGLNGNAVAVCGWAKDATSNNVPNGRQAFTDIVKSGADKYFNEVYGNADAEGNLTIEIVKPGFGGGSDWFTFCNAQLFEVSNKVTAEEAEALLATVPTAKMNAEVAAALAEAKAALEANATIPNYNALQAAIEAANASVAVYQEVAAALGQLTPDPAAFAAAVAEVQAAYEAGTITDGVAELAAISAAAQAVWADNLATIEAGEYLLQNVETGKYLGAGNAWGTQASLLTRGILWEIAIVDGKYTLDSHIANSATSHYLNGTYTDGAATPFSIANVEGGNVALFNAAGEFLYSPDNNIIELTTTPNATSVWKLISKADLYAQMTAATEENPVDATVLVKDANFDRNNTGYSAWVWSFGASNNGNNHNNAGNNDNFVVESFHAQFALTQAVNVPNGRYLVTAQGFYRQDGEDNDHLPYFFANDQKANVPAKTGEENSMANASTSFSAGLYKIDAMEVTVTDGVLNIGVSNMENDALWVIFDNFEVTCLGMVKDELTVKVGEAGFGTFVAPFEVAVPAGAKAYTVDAVENNLLVMTEVATIAANTPVVIEGECNATVSGFSFAEPAVAGLLTGVYTDTPAPAGSYVLQNQAAGVGFYQVGAVVPTVKANHAYLTAPAGTEARFFGLGGETAINAIDALTSGKAQIFDLNGRKLNSLQKGINIVNGVKILVK